MHAAERVRLAQRARFDGFDQIACVLEWPRPRQAQGAHSVEADRVQLRAERGALLVPDQLFDF
ncbi:MAG TPA: hypothetical protein VJN18_11030 [Polyangiaceae bacterium]|nr:hypothetical protein [Polyangiaceae bacterium]